MPNCPQCGEELGSGDPAGLCPQCLIQGAFDSSLGADESGTQTIQTATAAAGDDDFVRYQILRPLGEGGMGTVYLAEQREPIRRSVALKVVKLGMDTSQVLARFANERQALAMMDHPNIARIFDAGATPKGRPYFVMEYIEGVPITQYCDRNRIAIGQRLELFLAVCRAVQHAHQKGVIHRDLKPSNVLVMEQEGAPVPKVIDFGIAKATDQWAVENTLLTQFGQMVGTPEYASPEQAEVTTGDVDESSDVYSLGVILYELLVGAVPYDAASMRQAGLAEMLRIIREEEAPSLSRKLTTMGAAAADIAARRQTDLASLRRLVDGDLNSIAMKALEKVRERRYPSVTEFAADIQRYIEHRPVLASPAGRLYRARKFLRRHRPAAFGGSRRARVYPVERTNGLVARAPRLSAQTQVGRQTGTIVLGEFANTTGDPAFRCASPGNGGGTGEITLPQRAFRCAHERDTAPDGPAGGYEAYARMLRPKSASGRRSAAVVDGSVTSLGSQYLLSLHARNCRTGDVLDQEQAPAAKKEDVFKALGEWQTGSGPGPANRFHRVEKEPSLPTEVTTPSLEAWRSFSAAMKPQQRGAQATEVIPLLKRATEIDPKFAMAYANLGRLYASFGESELGAQNIAKAYELRNGVSDLENYFITFNYHRQVTRNLELARQTLESWAQKYPAGSQCPTDFWRPLRRRGPVITTKPRKKV